MLELNQFLYNGLSIPYYKKEIKINGRNFQNNFIIDIRKMNEPEISMLFANFDDFQEEFLGDIYFDKSYSRNFNLYFLHDGILSNEEMLNIKLNFIYAYKDFITNEQFEKIINKKDLTVSERNFIYTYSDDEFLIRNFNLIYGNNATGKTRLLNFIANEEGVPIFYMHKDINTSQILSYYKEPLENLKRIIDYCLSNNIPILIDDLNYCALDTRNRLKIVDQLYEYSNTNNVVITDCKSSNGYKGLVKHRTHNPNIIDLNEKTTFWYGK